MDKKMKPIKYPRTIHLPYSHGTTNDDKKLISDEHFIGKEVIVTEKMDGENTTISNEYVHARSIDGYTLHPSRTLIKNIHSNISHRIPKNLRLCGDNMVAKHSIHYKQLESFIYIYSAWIGIEKEWRILEFDDLCKYIDYLNEYLGKPILCLSIPKVLYRGIYNRNIIQNLYTPIKENGDEMEGYVVQINKKFRHNEFNENVAKYVRQGHVQSDEHWLQQEMIKNELRKEKNEFYK
jgi:hypothetical protein